MWSLPCLVMASGLMFTRWLCYSFDCYVMGTFFCSRKEENSVFFGNVPHQSWLFCHGSGALLLHLFY